LLLATFSDLLQLVANWRNFVEGNVSTFAWFRALLLRSDPFNCLRTLHRGDERPKIIKIKPILTGISRYKPVFTSEANFATFTAFAAAKLHFVATEDPISCIVGLSVYQFIDTRVEMRRGSYS